MKTQFFLLFACAAILISLGGCADTGTNGISFVREGVDFGYITKVGVLPFENNTEEKYAAEKIRDIVATQILVLELFDVVDKGLVDSAMREMGIGPQTPMDVPLTKRLAQRLGVQGFISGSVNSLSNNSLGSSSFKYSEASITIKLLDSESAQVLWRGSDALNGYSLADRLFGLEPMDIFQVTVSLIRRMLGTIPK